MSSALALTACKKTKEDTCKPDEKGFAKVRLVLQPTEEINLDPEGTPRATSVRIYQLKNGRTLDVPLDFREVWQNAEEVFGEEFLKVEELTVYPGKPDVVEIEPEEEATHFVAAAIFREPAGTSWYSEWTVPLYHGHSVCAAEKKSEVYEDPCFLLFIEGNQIDGGHKPPPGMDEDAIPITCPPPPLKVKPAPPAEGKKKKKKKGKGKDAAAGAQDAAGKGQDAAGKGQGAADAVSNPPAPGKG
ncbi:MAG: type VI secretion system lipoprotein TssJ [Myxococcota bacterium]